MIRKHIFLLLFTILLLSGTTKANDIPKNLSGGNPQTFSVNITSYAAKLEGDEIILKWQTISEENSNHFNLKVSKDGVSFEKIASLAGAGNSNSRLNYQFNYPKSSYIKILSAAFLLLVSFRRPTKYFTIFFLAALLVVGIVACKKESPAVGVLYFALEQVDHDGHVNQLGMKIVKID